MQSRIPMWYTVNMFVPSVGKNLRILLFKELNEAIQIYWIRIRIRIRIQHFKWIWIGTDPGFWWPQKWKKIKLKFFFFFFQIKNSKNRFPYRTDKLQEKPPALRREHPALQKMKFIHCFLFFRAIFPLLDPDPDCESGSTTLDPWYLKWTFIGITGEAPNLSKKMV
jgi:hypothetical protein